MQPRIFIFGLSAASHGNGPDSQALSVFDDNQPKVVADRQDRNAMGLYNSMGAGCQTTTRHPLAKINNSLG
jgi:hypothetical protein